MTKRTIQLAVLVVLTFTCAFSATLEKTKTTYTSLFAGYNKYFRPLVNQSQTVTVNVTFYLISIDDFDEVSGTLSIMGVLIEAWVDESLTWDPTTDGLESLVLPQDIVWRPTLFNVKVAAKFGAISDSNFKVIVFPNGHVIWMPGGLMQVKCSPNVQKFPFDEQTCQVDLITWGYLKYEVLLKPAMNTIDDTFYEPNPEWSIVSSNLRSEIKSDYSFLVVELTIRRLPLFHLLNTLLPIVLLALITPLVFLLPCESGERSGYSLTMLLSFTVFLTVVTETLPPSSDPMSSLSYYVFSILIYSGVISTVNVLQLVMFFKDESSPVSPFILFVVKVVSCELCKRKRRITVEPHQGEETVEDSKRDTHRSESVKITWQSAVKTLDWFYFVFFMIVLMISTLMLFFHNLNVHSS